MGKRDSIRAPIRYAGGKTRALKFIDIPDVPVLVSPFLGGGAIEVAASQRGIKVLGYDVFDILVNFWQVLLTDPESLVEELRKWSPDAETYANVKNTLKFHWKGQVCLNPLELAAHYFFNFQLSYGPNFLGYTSSIYHSHTKYDRMLARLKEFKLKDFTVECKSFEEVIPLTDEFMYLDPPYRLEDSKIFTGIYPSRNCPIHHKNFDHNLLAKLLKAHRGKFILSYNDCEWVRRTYNEYNIREVYWHYSLGQGEVRLGLNRKKRENPSHIKRGGELLIKNW